MNVNDVYSDIMTFWDNIYPIILFHFLLYLLYRFLFKEISLKKILEKYVESPGFMQLRKILEKFELWKKLPFIILITLLVYLALFNSALNIFTSLPVYPFEFIHSYEEFLYEYNPKEDLLQIAKYGADTTGGYFELNQLREKYLEEYKLKHPDKYKSWIGWTKKSFAKYSRYYHLFGMLIITLIILFIRKIRKAEEKRLLSILKLLLVLFLSMPVFFVLRYKTEQKIENGFANEVIFVKTELAMDTNQKQILTDLQLESIRQKWSKERQYSTRRSSLFWVSRIVGRREFLENLLGKRRLSTAGRTRYNKRNLNS